MTLAEKTLNEVPVLRGWRGMDVLTSVDENPKDIWMMVLYDYHGDDFLIVRTRDMKTYRYGCYANLKHSELYTYVREPKLYKKFDEHAVVSNKIYRRFNNAFCKGWGSIMYDKKYYDKTTAQLVYDDELRFISNLAATADVIFDYDIDKIDVRDWLMLNEICTKENIEKLNNAKFDSKTEINGHRVIGVSGKEDISNLKELYVDGVSFIMVNDKYVDYQRVLYGKFYDDWGVESYCLNLNGFRPAKLRE